jgi:hypothetical protein
VNEKTATFSLPARMYLSLAAFFTLSVNAAAAPNIHLPLLRNLATGAVVFDDNFESYAVPASPTAPNIPSTAAALTGTWAYGSNYGTHTTGVINTERSAFGTVVPQEGGQCLMMSSGAVSSGRQMIARGAVANSGTSDTLELNVAFQFAAGGSGALLYFYGGSGQSELLAAIYIRGSATGSIPANSVGVLNADGNSWVKAGVGSELAFTPDQWHALKVVHTNGTRSWNISLDGGEPIFFTGLEAGNSNAFNTVNFSLGSPATVYFDAVGIPAEPLTPTTNCIANPGFENDLVNWVATPATDVTIDSAVARAGGAKSVKLSASARETSAKTIEQTLPIHPGTYPVSLWMKTQNAGSAQARVLVGNQSHHLRSTSMVETGDWTQLMADIVVPPGVTTLTVQARIWGGADGVNPGFLWVDDCVVEDPLRAEMDRGHYLLLCRGLQIEGLVFPETWFPTEWVGFNVARFVGADFTTVNFVREDSRWPSLLGPPADGVQWSRIGGPVRDTLPFVPSTTEFPYLGNMARVQLGDEQTLADQDAAPNDPATIAAVLADTRRSFPNLINGLNQSGVHINEPNWSNYFQNRMRNYMATSQPDMLMFDSYLYVWGGFRGGSPKEIYEHWQRFRQLGLAGNDGTGTTPIPYALYLQYFAPNDYVMSDSETRLNQFAAWLFGYTFVSAFTYDNIYGSGEDSLRTFLFTGSGDTNPTPLFHAVAETNRQSRNLGASLVRLISTDVRIAVGQHYDSPTEAVLSNAIPAGVPVWSPAAHPHLTTINATNLGIHNLEAQGMPLKGDVLVGFFKPLHESFDGPDFQNQDYFMILNGLAWSGASVAETRQSITVDFDFGGSGINGLQRLRRNDGQVEPISVGGSYSDLTWTRTGAATYQLTLTLDGGTADLFKFDTGAPFVGVDGLPSIPVSYSQEQYDAAVEAGQSAGRAEVIGDPGSFNLYTAETIQDLRTIGSVMIAAGTNSVNLTLPVEKSSDLESWEAVGDLHLDLPKEADKAFYRLKIK